MIFNVLLIIFNEVNEVGDLHYCLLTEQSMDDPWRTNPDPWDKDKTPYHTFKSSEWIAYLALQHMTNRPHDLGRMLLLDKFDPDTCFVIFDDGLYSGLQKRDALKYLLKPKISCNVYLIASFYSHQAIETIRSLFCCTNGGDVYTETIYTDHIQWSGNGNNIYLWTGGTKMECTGNLVHRYFNDKDKALKYLARTGYFDVRGIDSYHSPDMYPCAGATLSLFEHKIPDDASLVRIAGTYFASKMKVHYEYNPPYKRMPVIAKPLPYFEPPKPNKPQSGGGDTSTRLFATQKVTKALATYKPVPITPYLTDSEIKIIDHFDKTVFMWLMKAVDSEMNRQPIHKLQFAQLTNKTLTSDDIKHAGYVTCYTFLADMFRIGQELSWKNGGIYMLLREIINRIVYRMKTRPPTIGGGRKVIFIKDGKKNTRVVQINKRGNECVRYNGKLVSLSRLKLT